MISVVTNPPAKAGDALVYSLVCEDLTCWEQLSPCTITPEPVLESPGTAVTKACMPRVHDAQEKQ